VGLEQEVKPHQRAKAWRERRKLTREQLSELSGYTTSMIYKFEAGFQRPGIEHSEFVMQRYRLVCAGIDAQLRTGRVFEW
jgi:transcriptional regulator with XRE-family HTH domain